MMGKIMESRSSILEVLSVRALWTSTPARFSVAGTAQLEKCAHEKNGPPAARADTRALGEFTDSTSPTVPVHTK